MAKLKVVGCKISTGVYEGHNYNNLVLHCICEGTDDFEGCPVEIVKVSVMKAGYLLQEVEGDLSKIVDLTIDPIYDRNGRVDRILIVDAK